jgi:hypothetical protein
MSKRKGQIQPELPVLSGVFNLVGEVGEDLVRLAMEAGRAAAAREAAKEFERAMQRKLEECPGFIGADPPRGPDSIGKVLIEPVRISEAMVWLARRFRPSENLTLSHDFGICVEIIPRVPRKPGVKRRQVKFGKPEQFTLDF